MQLRKTETIKIARNMNKLNSIAEFSIVVNRGYGSKKECEYFENLDHPKLIESFIAYINLHKDLIGVTKIEDRQSIADSGCDVYVELRNTVKIGVQIKSPNDLKEDTFSMKVKAQYSETKTLTLDKYYVIICCAMTPTNTRKVNYLTSHFATYKTNYHAILIPQNSIRIFNPGGLIPLDEFQDKKQFYSYEDDESKILALLSTIHNEIKQTTPKESEIGAAVNAALDRPLFQTLSGASKFISFLQLEKETKPELVLNDINEFISKYSKLSPELRRLYYLIIKESSDAPHFVDGLEMNLHELNSLLGVEKHKLMGNLKVLDSPKYKLLRIDEDEPDVVSIHIWLHGNYNFIKEIIFFAEENEINLDEIFMEGNFSLLDN